MCFNFFCPYSQFKVSLPAIFFSSSKEDSKVFLINLFLALMGFLPKKTSVGSSIISIILFNCKLFKYGLAFFGIKIFTASSLILFSQNT